MWIWFFMLMFGVCSGAGLYMAVLAYRLDDSGVYLFGGAGVFFGLMFLAAAVKAGEGRFLFLKRLNERLAKPLIDEKIPERSGFTPHWFMMGAVVIAGILIIAAIIVPFIFKHR